MVGKELNGYNPYSPSFLSTSILVLLSITLVREEE